MCPRAGEDLRQITLPFLNNTEAPACAGARLVFGVGGGATNRLSQNQELA